MSACAVGPDMPVRGFDGGAWVSQHTVDMIARFDPRTEEWVEFPWAEAESDPRRSDHRPDQPEPHLLFRQHPEPRGLHRSPAELAAARLASSKFESYRVWHKALDCFGA